MIWNFVSDLILTKLPNKFKFLTYYWASNVEVLLIGRPSHVQYVSGYQLPFDRVLDPIRFALQSRCSAISVFLGTDTSRRTGRKRLRLLHKGQIKSVEGLVESRLIEQLKLREIDDKILTKELLEASRKFWSGYYSFKQFIDRSRNLRAVVVSVWYSPEMMGVIAAARQNNIVVVDVQHGADDSNAMGSWKMQSVPRLGYQMAPNYLWRWNQSKNLSADKDLKGKAITCHKFVVGGYPWISYWRFLREQSANCANARTPQQRNKYQVLFSVRNPFGESRERIPEFLLEFLRLPHPDVTVVIRLHPNDFVGQRHVEERLAGTLRTPYRVGSPKDDLYELLSESTHLVSAHSAVCLEALTLGVPTLLFGEDAKVNYKEILESNRATWTSGNLADLEKFIFNETCQGSTPIIVSSLDLTAETISAILEQTR
jgi:hypothetical protein